ncbi:MAG: ribonuclease P protein component [Bacteroidia bacterium]|jgi:ribonuclease P protein component|nr:ribonuclease P protein component [Paludibacter sp.]MDD3491003.1 ribonuclease P protein component [Paludibacter sp.]NCB67797.1 ribonuclease P protein component [Bacteroidia bacterium]
MNRKYTFPKKEHLCGEIRIGKLFSEGEAFIAYPFRIVYSVSNGNTEETPKMLFSAPKKRFKRAVARNHIKRLMREAYRLNKLELKAFCEANNLQLQVAFSFVGDSIPEWDFVELKMKAALKRLETNVQHYLLAQNNENKVEE